MAKVTPRSEHFQHFLAEMKERFWGDRYGGRKPAWPTLFRTAVRAATGLLLRLRGRYERAEKAIVTAAGNRRYNKWA
jgi:hypothetical protein